MTRTFKRCIFLILIKVIVSDDIIGNIEFKIVEETNKYLIISLPVVEPDRIYIVDVSKVN